MLQWRAFIVLALASIASAASAAADPARYMSAAIIAESDDPKPGSSILVGFQMTPRPGWHGYWSNPGDTGIAPSVRWAAPEGFGFGPLMHPAPTLLTADGISSFVHEGPHVLLSRVTIPRSIAPGTRMPVKAHLAWAACTATQCVPLQTTLNLDLIAGRGQKSADFPMLKAAERQLPATTLSATFERKGASVRLLLPGSLRMDPRRVRFFPHDNADFATAEARGAIEQGALAIVGPSASTAMSMSGVLSDGRRAWRIRFDRVEPVEESQARVDVNQGDAATAAPNAPATATADGNPPPSQSARDTSRPPRDVRWIWIAAGAAIAGLLFYLIGRRRS
jgi:DsbC/DsbD-like thiol-disulfide interchange protein